MRKFITLIALCGLLIPAACNKQEPINSVEDQQQEVTLNLNIGTKPGFDTPSAVDGAQVGTRAVKTGWENDDHLYVFLLEDGADYSTEIKQVVLTHNGTEFTVTQGQENLNAISKNGTIECIYISGNETGFAPYGFGGPMASYDLNGRFILGSAVTTYAFAENKITATIALQRSGLTDYQVTLLMESDTYNWTLETPNGSFDEYNELYTALDVQFSSMATGATPTVSASPWPSDGFHMADGVAFYFAQSYSPTKPLRLILKNKSLSTTYTLNMPDGKRFSSPGAYKLKGPKIDESGNLVEPNGWTKS